MHQHFAPHNTTSNHQMAKDTDKGLMLMDLLIFITHKMMESTSEDSTVFPARSQNIKILLSNQLLVTSQTSNRIRFWTEIP